MYYNSNFLWEIVRNKCIIYMSKTPKKKFVFLNNYTDDLSPSSRKKRRNKKNVHQIPGQATIIKSYQKFEGKGTKSEPFDLLSEDNIADTPLGKVECKFSQSSSVQQQLFADECDLNSEDYISEHNENETSIDDSILSIRLKINKKPNGTKAYTICDESRCDDSLVITLGKRKREGGYFVKKCSKRKRPNSLRNIDVKSEQSKNITQRNNNSNNMTSNIATTTTETTTATATNDKNADIIVKNSNNNNNNNNVNNNNADNNNNNCNNNKNNNNNNSNNNNDNNDRSNNKSNDSSVDNKQLCVPISNRRLHLPYLEYPMIPTLGLRKSFVPIEPKIKRKINQFRVRSDCKLPIGLYLDVNTGRITGKPLRAQPSKVEIIIVGRNIHTGDECEAKIVVRIGEETSVKYKSNLLLELYKRYHIKPKPNKNAPPILSYALCEDSMPLPKSLKLDPKTGDIRGKLTQYISNYECKILTVNETGVEFITNLKFSAKEINLSIFYPANEDLIIGEEMDKMIPQFEGDHVPKNLKFSTHKDFPLPNGIIIDENTGIISGKVMSSTCQEIISQLCIDSIALARTIHVRIGFNIIRPVIKVNYPQKIDHVKYRVDNVHIVPTVNCPMKFRKEKGCKMPKTMKLNNDTGEITGFSAKLGKIDCIIEAYNEWCCIECPITFQIERCPIQVSYSCYEIIANNQSFASLKPKVECDIKSIRYRIINGQLPKGCNLNKRNGELKGKNVEYGTFKFTIEAYGTGCIECQLDFKLVVQREALKCHYISKSIQFEVGTRYTGLQPKVNRDNFDGFKIVKGKLPNGIQLNRKTGILSGIPLEEVEKNKVTIMVFDENNTCETQLVVSSILPSKPKVEYKITRQVFNINEPIKMIQPNILKGPIRKYTIEPSLPRSLLFDSHSGIISGVVTQAFHETKFTIEALNEAGKCQCHILLVGLEAFATELYESHIAICINDEMEEIAPIFTYDEVLKYKLLNEEELPKGLVFNPNEGTINGTPKIAGDFNLSIEIVCPSTDQKAIAEINLTVYELKNRHLLLSQSANDDVDDLSSMESDNSALSQAEFDKHCLGKLSTALQFEEAKNDNDDDDDDDIFSVANKKIVDFWMEILAYFDCGSNSCGNLYSYLNVLNDMALTTQWVHPHAITLCIKWMIKDSTPLYLSEKFTHIFSNLYYSNLGYWKPTAYILYSLRQIISSLNFADSYHQYDALKQDQLSTLESKLRKMSMCMSLLLFYFIDKKSKNERNAKKQDIVKCLKSVNVYFDNMDEDDILLQLIRESRLCIKYYSHHSNHKVKNSSFPERMNQDLRNQIIRNIKLFLRCLKQISK